MDKFHFLEELIMQVRWGRDLLKGQSRCLWRLADVSARGLSNLTQIQGIISTYPQVALCRGLLNARRAVELSTI